jgi:hypothetical protein
MRGNRVVNEESKIGYIILLINIVFLVAWLVENNTNVYKVPLVGAIYELIWLPLLLCLFTIPVITFILWRKHGFKLRSKFFFLMILSVISIGSLFILSK